MGELDQWLEGIGLGQYAEILAREHVDLALLPALTDHDLRALGLPLGHRRIMLDAIERLSGSGPAVSSVWQAGAPAGDAERRQLTVMFCDLVNSSALARQLDPEDLRDVIGAYRHSCTLPVQRFGGFVQRFVGDGVLAFFGYPTALEDEAERAIRAGLGIVEEVGRLAAEVRSKHALDLKVRIGIATGPVVVGDILGEGLTERAAVVGQAPNFAARLQELAAPNAIVIALATRQLAAERFEYLDLGEHTLKGFEHATDVFQVLRERPANRLEARGSILTSLFGRERELTRLLSLWAKCENSEGQVVFVCGSAGLGKSRLAAAVRQQVASSQAADPQRPPRVLSFQCQPFHVNAVLHPVIRQLEGLAGIELADSGELKLSKLNSLLDKSALEAEGRPFIADLLGIKVPGSDPAIGSRERRQRTLEALQAWIGSFAADRPLLLIFEDLQWLDPTSKQLFGRLVSWAQGSRTLIIATLRTNGSSHATPTGSNGSKLEAVWLGQRHVNLCTLSQLGVPESKQLVQEATRGRPLTASMVETIVRRAEGNPLYIEELTKGMVDLQTGEAAEAVEGSRLQSIPATLSGYLLVRLDQLGPAREVAQSAAVIGPEFSLDLLSKIMAVPGDRLLPRLESLIKAELIARSDTPAGVGFVFKHALIQDAAYQSLLRRTRKTMHLRIAEELRARQSGDASITHDVIAEHYALGDAHRDAIEEWKRAAEIAFERSAQVEAANLLGKALAIVGELPEEPGRLALELELTMQLAAALGSTQGYAAPEVERKYMRAGSLCDALGKTLLRFNVDFGLMLSNLVKGDLRSAGRFAQALMQSSEQHPDQPRVDAYLANGMVQMNMGRFDEARTLLERGVALTRPEFDEPHFFTHGQNPGIFCRSYLAHALAFMGRADDAIRLIRENVALAKARSRDARHIYTHVNALAFACRVYLLLRDNVAVNQLSGELISISRRNSYAYYETIGTIQQGWAMATAGAWAPGARQMRDGLALLEQTGTGLGARGFHVQLAEIQIRLGDKLEALNALDKAGQPRGLGTRAWDAEIERVRGEAFLLPPDAAPSAAETSFANAMTIARRQEARVLQLRAAVSQARLLQRLSRTEEGHALLGECMRECEGMRGTRDFSDAEEVIRA